MKLAHWIIRVLSRRPAPGARPLPGRNIPNLWTKRPPPPEQDSRPFRCATPQAHAAYDHIKEKQARGKPLTIVEQQFLAFTDGTPKSGVTHYPGVVRIPAVPPRNAEGA